ncbi:MAG: sacsin N-terminal ATP-binding-like domain-containing protein [Streptosporangiaceae bacterium]
MPADYQRIREENIARYGWDTAVLDLLGQLYSERTHFIFELIQNAEDAGATELAFELFEDRLELRHDGRPFTEADVRGLCGVGQSDKASDTTGDLTAIGKFGIGFKSVYAYTRTPRIYSGGEAFRIENFVRPYAVNPPAEPVAETLFVFPFDHDPVPAEVAAREIAAALDALQPRILLFLRNIGRLRTGGRGAANSVVERSVVERSVADGPGAARRVTVSRDGRREGWLTWQRPVEGHPGQRVEVAFRLEGERVSPVGASPLTAFFPTEKETFLGFLIQGPYRTTPARDNIPGDDPSNQALMRQTAVLLTDVLPELRDEGLLTADALQALPLDAARFPAGSMFRPLFDAAGDALTAEALIPMAGGGYGVAVDLLLADRPEVLGLLDPGQLGVLCGAGRPVWFADAAISERDTPSLWRYLRDEIGVDEITPEAVVSRLTGEFLKEQDDPWITRFYRFLAGHPSLWPAATAKPIIRLEDGRQVAPFDGQGRPAVYLPGPVPSSLPTVKRAVADSAAARTFLTALQLTVPDVVAEVLQMVLPRYDGLDLAALDPAQHDADLERVARALDEAAGGRRAELLESVAATPFLIAENAATGEQALLPPPRLYQRSKDLEAYFEGNPDAWFARDGYGPWLVQLRTMGVRQAVEVSARTPNAAGYVMITVDFGRNERGLDGFDPAAAVDGLDFALAHPSHARSEYVWNVLLAPNRRLVAGVVERSVLTSFSDSSLAETRSAMGEAAARQAWLPGRDGAFRRPGELSLDDLPPTYTRDEGLAQALGMLRPAVSEAARQLGVPAEVLWGLSERPDLVALIERELGQQP